MTDQVPMLPAGVSSVADLGTVLTLREVADRLGVSVKTARRMVSRGELESAHQVPMSNGRGTQWVVPVSSVEKASRQPRAAGANKADPSDHELQELRAKVSELEQRAELLQALADERAHQLEQLHLTVRLALNSGEQQRRWWRRKGTH